MIRDPNSEDTSVEIEINEAPADTAVPPIKRKRGRPPGSRNKPKEPTPEPTTAPTEESKAGEPSGPPPISPGPGAATPPPPPIGDRLSVPAIGLARVYGDWLISDNKRMREEGWPFCLPDEVINQTIVPMAEYLENEVFKDVKLSKRDTAIVVVGAPLINSAANRLVKRKASAPKPAPTPPQPAPAPPVVETPSPAPPTQEEQTRSRPNGRRYTIGG